MRNRFIYRRNQELTQPENGNIPNLNIPAEFYSIELSISPLTLQNHILIQLFYYLLVIYIQKIIREYNENIQLKANIRHECARLKNPTHVDLKRKLVSAVNYANNTCILGAGNKIEDIKRTHGWGRVLFFRYHSGKYERNCDIEKKDKDCNATFNAAEKKFKILSQQWNFHKQGNSSGAKLLSRTTFDPLENNIFNMTKEQRTTLEDALVALHHGVGNCRQRASLVSKYLWENPVGIHRIEIINLQFDHVFVLVNRSNGDLNNFESWGDAWVIDAWYKDGIIFHASEFKNKIKEIQAFVKQQEDEIFKLKNMDKPNEMGHEQAIKCTCVCEIKPHVDCYPRQSAFATIEDYYELVLFRAFKNSDEYRKCKAKHKAKFKECLNELSQLPIDNQGWLKSMRSQSYFFRSKENINILIELTTELYTNVFKIEEYNHIAIMELYDVFRDLCKKENKIGIIENIQMLQQEINNVESEILRFKN